MVLDLVRAGMGFVQRSSAHIAHARRCRDDAILVRKMSIKTNAVAKAPMQNVC